MDVKYCQILMDGLMIKYKLCKNKSGRFESRWSVVKIYTQTTDTTYTIGTTNTANNIFFKNMNDMVFGILTAHGEGRFDI